MVRAKRESETINMIVTSSIEGLKYRVKKTKKGFEKCKYVPSQVIEPYDDDE